MPQNEPPKHRTVRAVAALASLLCAWLIQRPRTGWKLHVSWWVFLLSSCAVFWWPTSHTVLFWRWGYTKAACALGAVVHVSSPEGQQQLQQRIVIADAPPAPLWQVELMFRWASSMSGVKLQWWKQKRNKLFHPKGSAKLFQGYFH